MNRSSHDYREQLRPYANRELDILVAWFHDQLTQHEYDETRALAYLAHGYPEAARRWWDRIKCRRMNGHDPTVNETTTA